MDVLFEVVTLIQNKMIAGLPVVIFDTEYHKNLCEHIGMMVQHESVSKQDMELLFVTDSVPDLMAHIEKHAIKKFGLRKIQYKPKWWFGESRR